MVHALAVLVLAVASAPPAPQMHAMAQEPAVGSRLAARLDAGTQQRDSVWVRGLVELSEAEAEISARVLVLERLKAQWAQRGQERAQEVLPSWTPGFVAARAIQRFLTDRQFDPAAIEGLVRIADRTLQTHSHGFGDSYEVSLRVVPDAECLQVTTRLLDRRLRAAQQTFWALCGGAVLLWAFLALGTAWLDRLTRSFMTGRLIFGAVGVGLALPAVAFLL